jgi:outer membrane usher protein FimD/PapC
MRPRAFASLSLLILTLLLSVHPARGDQTIILNVILNSEEKGDFFVLQTEDGDFLIRIEDLRQMGFREPQVPVFEIDQERYISIRSIKGLEFRYDERTLTIELFAMPAHLGRTVIDFIPPAQPDVEYPKDTAGFLNYRLDYSLEDASDVPAVRTFDFTNQIGLRYTDFLFLSDSVYTNEDAEDRLVRLMTNVTYDRRDRLQRVVVGDFFTSSGELGSTLNLGGISFQKAYLINPYLITHPTIDLSGAVSLPTEIQVVLDGMPIRQERLSPGEFELKNLSTRTGAGLLEVVLKDPFGREQRIRYPFYLTEILLKRGLHDYRYHLGFEREGFGEDSGDYGRLVFSGLHRYGFTDILTAQFRFEAARKAYSLGPSLSHRIFNDGIVSFAAAASQNPEGDTGRAGSVTYGYQGRRVNIYLLGRAFTESYSPLLAPPEAEKPRYETVIGTGYSTLWLGSLTMDYTAQQMHVGTDRTVVSVGYSKTLREGLSFLTSLKRIHEEESSYEFLIGLHYNPGKDTSVSARHQRNDDGHTEVVQVQKNAPVGEGFGGRALYERADAETGLTQTADGFLQYNNRYGITTAEYRTTDGSRVLQVSGSGAAAMVGGVVGLSRPITDSFGLVEVGDLKDVRIYHNNQEVGRTDSSGRLFIPTLGSYYNNQISINDQDIPINYTIPEVLRYISPPLRSGSHVRFEATRFQAIIGRLMLRLPDGPQSAEFYEASFVIGDRTVTFPTGKGGEFYIENIPPGEYRATVMALEKPCFFDIMVPESEEPLVDLGELTCEPGP